MILVIDHHDSFINMICDYITVLGHNYQLIKTDDCELNNIDIAQYDHIIIGPGPGHPHDKSLVLIYELLEKALALQIPVLGICLGHQIIATYFGLTIKTAATICHGIVEPIIICDRSKLFANTPHTFNVTRYHSLLALESEPINTSLKITARTQNHEIMALEHCTYNVFGVQFHPESIMTEYGHQILKNFLSLN